MASSSSSNIQKNEIPFSMAEEKLKHFSHEHSLSLLQLQPDHINENSDNEKEDEDEDKNDYMVPKDLHVGTCKMCEEEIHSFHLCYYSCKDCVYSLHKFCAELPTIQQNHPLHPNHELTLSQNFQLRDLAYLESRLAEESFTTDIVDSEWICSICNIHRIKFYNYHCDTCKFNMDIICATMSEQIIDHPSHPHRLRRYLSRMICSCNACGDEHSGTFYHCSSCSGFRINLDCVLLPAKLFIQQTTDETFTHPHFLTLAYSFPFIEQRDKFFPRCRVCEKRFLCDKWHYRCNKCRYYVHVDCAISRKDSFMSSILMPAGHVKTYNKLKEDGPLDLIRCPFPDESVNLLKHRFFNNGELSTKREIDGDMFSHSHQLILFCNESVSHHDPLKKVELLCDGCVRPITDVRFYKCCEPDCGFVLHEWCTRLPSKIHDQHEHTLVFLPKIHGKKFGVFWCEICDLPSNSFAYGCTECEYYVDIHCGFIPNVIRHEAHPNHFLKRVDSPVWNVCKACRWLVVSEGFHCSTCDFYLHTKCTLLLPRTIKHRFDKHPLTLRYNPVQDHSSEYFCDICEDELNPKDWFYHCSTCASFMHTACAPLKLQCEQSTYAWYDESIFKYINVKFGGIVEIGDHPHPLTFAQGINADGECTFCKRRLQYEMILKCFQCKFAIHYWCVKESAIRYA